MPTDYGKRLPCDPRIVEKIQRSPQMMAEQGSTFLTNWGGPGAYQMAANLPVKQRVTYYAVSEGLTTPEEISIAVDLSVEEVNSALSQLSKKGLVTIAAEPMEL